MGFDDALALHRHQRSGKAKRHAHLELGGLAHLVALLLGQQVDAVVVFAAKPQFALAGHPHGRSSLAGVAVAVGGGHHQFHLTGLVQLGVAQQQTPAVALAGAHRAQVFGGCLVVVAVEAAHHALARGGGDARNGLHLQRRIGRCLAVVLQRQGLEADLLAGRCPALGLDARHHARRPQRVGAAQGLHFAIGVGVGGFQQQLTRLAGLGQVVDGDLAGAVAVQRQGQLVGHHTRVLASAGFFIVALRVDGALVAGRREAEHVVVGKLQVLAAHQGRHAHRQVRRATARHVIDLHIGGHRAHAHQGLAVGRGNAPFQHRQAELFHAELAGGDRATLCASALQLHAVFTQLGSGRNGKAVHGTQPARGGFAPLHRLFKLLAAAHMGDEQGAWARSGCVKALAVFQAVVVLHRHRLARAQQGAVEHRVRPCIGLDLAAGGHVKAPGLNAPLPVAPGEGHVFHPALRMTGTDEIGRRTLSIVVVAVARRRIGRQPLDHGHALLVGDGLRQFAPSAVRHAHFGARHRFALVQRGDPHRRVFTPQLEVHAQVGHQRRGAHVHGAALAMASIQQRSTQLLRCDLDHMEARRQRNAHHLERAQFLAGDLGQVQRLDTALPRQQREHARLHMVALVVDHLGQRALHIARGHAALHVVVVVARHLAEPGNDVGIGRWLERAHLACGRYRRCGRWRSARLQALHLEARFHIAQRHRQQRGAVRPFGKSFHHAKRRSSKFCQRRQARRSHPQRKARGIAQGAARGVFEILGQLQREAGLLGQGRVELHAVDHGISIAAVLAAIHPGLEGLVSRLEPDGHGQLARHRGVERQRQRAQWHAGRLGVFTLAAEFGRKRFAHAVGEALFHAVGHPAGRGHALAKHQLQLRAGGKPAVAGKAGELQRLFRGPLFQAQGLEQVGALGTFNHAHRHALAHAFQRAPHVGLHALGSGGPVELQHKELLFVELLVGVGPHALHKGAAAIELIALCARQQSARG